MTDKEKIRACIDYLTESHLDHEGGYPYASVVYRGRLFVATLDGDNETALETYLLSTLLAWFNRAAMGKVTGHYEDMDEALMEEQPEEDLVPVPA